MATESKREPEHDDELLTQPGGSGTGAVVDLNDPRQTEDGNWLRQKPRPPDGKRVDLTERFDRAVEYTSHVHGGQRRKETAVPYLAHLLGVASIVLEDQGDEDEAIAALLHDAPEDQGGWGRLDDIVCRFGNRVGMIVEHCSDTFEKKKPKWLLRKQKYIADLREERSSSVLRVSGADKLHNLRAIAADFYTDGAHVFCRFKGGKEGALWYHACLLNVYREHAKAKRLSAALHQQLEVAFAALLKIADPTFHWPVSERELPGGWSLDYDPGEARCTCDRLPLRAEMNGAKPGRCPRCNRERPPAKGGAGGSESTDLCSTCRGFDNAAGNTFGLLGSEVLAVAGGWRDARMLDGDFTGWLCRHVHPTPEEAETCPEKRSILAERFPGDG